MPLPDQKVNNMDYTIEIIAKDTVKMHQQLYKVVMKTMRIVLAVLTAFMAVGYFMMFAESGSTDEMCAAVGYVAGFLASITLPLWTGSLSFRRKVKYYNGNLPENVVQFGDEICMKDGDSKYTIPYDKIKKIKVMDHCIFLKLQDGRNFGLPNGPFTKGSLQEMLALLKEKCPLLKLPDWQ